MNDRLNPIKYGAGKDALDAIAEELAELRRSQAERLDELTRAVNAAVLRMEGLGTRLNGLAMAPHIIASAIAKLGLVIAVSALAIVIAVVAG